MLSAGSRPALPYGNLNAAGLAPPDPRGLLTSIGIAVYDWDFTTDRITWADNAAQILGLKDLSGYASGEAFDALVDPGEEACRRDAIMTSSGRDGGSGVPYALRYGLQSRSGRRLEVEDTGRWYAAADGRPAVAHGTLRVAPAASAPGGPGQMERAAFIKDIAGDVATAAREKRPLTLFVAAVDNLSDLNERLGYDGADAAIAATLDRLHAVMRRRDGFVRYAGNRFALALRGCPPDQARIAGERFERAVSATPVALAGSEPGIGSRLLIGAATAPDHALEAAELLRRAEQSLAVAKRRVGASFVIYDPQIFRSHERRPADPSCDVLDLLNTRRITFARQPIVDATSRTVAFSEALLRVDQDGAIVSAGDIVPAMERSGLVALVDMRIMELATEYLDAHPDERVSINISPMTMESPDWLATLAAHIGGRRNIAPRLIVEVTESVAIRDPDAARRKLDAMKALGVTLAIDDFGAGHTSFKHLRNFPIDLVKIDGAFVQNLARSPNDRFFVQTLVELAHHLGLSTVAEWVEDEETAQLLAGWGIDYLQGDHCGVPVLAPKPSSAPPLRQRV